MQKKKLTLVIVSLLVVVLSVSLAYFTAQIIGKGKDVSVTSANLQIVFTDSDGALTETDIEPGWSATKTFTIKNDTKTEYKYNIVIKDLINTFVTNGYLQYKITSTNDGYNMTEFKDIPKSSAPKDTILAYSVNIPVGETQSYTIEFKYANDESVDQSIDMNKKLSGTLFITEGTEPTLLSQILNDNPIRSTRDTYDAVFTNNTTGTLFTATEKNVHNTTDTTVYYYAGNTTNNWVKFAGFYWRIIRTNADGSIRMLYSGTSHDTTSGYLSTGTSAFNSSSNSPKYVGYMYGDSDADLDKARTNTNNSTIKTYIDNWYSNNLSSYTEYLSTTAVYCNDRKVPIYSVSNSFDYYVTTRLNAGNLTYDCEDIKDAFSGSNSEAKLTYPIALMTADEITYAGGKVNTELTSPYAWYYLNSVGESITGSIWWWSLSPFIWNSANSYVWFVFGSSIPGALLTTADVKYENGVRPALSLKSCVKYSSGDGSASDPYTIKEIETETGC